ncbi:MAG TPA: AAA family ATPase, partial [Candidatus Kapabacteria bacterium]|nr:AAA family ATPase [Candidatus Kapabacteria bacterium]
KHGVKLSQDFQRELEEFEKQSAELIVSSVIDSRRTAFPYAEARAYLNEVEDSILSHLALFKGQGQPKPEGQEEQQDAPAGDDAAFRMFTVNLILDNSQTTESPVIIETQPTFNNIFGTIEKVYDARGVWITDFTKIKAGSLLRANGGYLIINALDALTEPGVWKTLKRVLLHRKIEIQPIDTVFQVTQSALKPEAIPTNVKVLIIGDEDIYDALYQYEEDFKKIFKINATFDYEMDRSKTAMLDYAKFIRRLSDEEELLPFSRNGVAAVINFSARRAGRQKKLTTQFSDVADLVREAHFFAQQAKARVVTADFVEQALQETIKRNGMLNDKLQEMIEENMMLIDTSGERVGQINGLAVYQLANTMFGKPSRITASVGVGSAGIINIERESKLSGSTHDKGVLILAGYFREKFATDKPLTFSSSICFEQSYSGVDGDSASSTEIYALLSALSGIPIKQQFAVTGSVNQKGDIQPIGGVNEKIEGFFDVCNARGLTGNQGVLIPYQNVEDLMLKKEVIDAVRKNKFSLYPVHTIDEGIAILTGKNAGKKTNGKFEAGSLNYHVDKRLREFTELLNDHKTGTKKPSKAFEERPKKKGK